MSDIGHFIYFLNSVKDSLSFKDAEDFTRKIRNDSDFRLKVQSFVYIARYFGWNHSYNYVLHDDSYSSGSADEKEILLDKINAYIDYFTDFGQCNNSITVSGTLDYLSMVLESETRDLEIKKSY